MKKCLIIANTYKDESEKLTLEIKDFLKSKEIECEVLKLDENEDFPSESEVVSCWKDFDFSVSLGGDGTVLFACRLCAAKKIPVFPVNLGLFGFIASVQKNEWEERLSEFLEGNAEIARRSMVEAAVFSGEEKSVFQRGLNDVVVSAKSSAGMVSLDVAYNGSQLCMIKADGIIVSTATGSTAYSASAGGPIIDSELDAFVLTLMNPFSLSTRPLVLKGDGEISLKILPSRYKEVVMTVDGQTPIDLKAGDMIKIKKSKDEALLVGCTREKFYDALRSKMNWMGGPRA